MILVNWTTILLLLELSATSECTRYLQKNSIKACQESIMECVLDEGPDQFEFCRDDVLEGFPK